MAGGRARASSSKLKTSGRTDELLDSLWVPDASTMFTGNDQLNFLKILFGFLYFWPFVGFMSGLCSVNNLC